MLSLTLKYKKSHEASQMKSARFDS